MPFFKNSRVHKGHLQPDNGRNATLPPLRVQQNLHVGAEGTGEDPRGFEHPWRWAEGDVTTVP